MCREGLGAVASAVMLDHDGAVVSGVHDGVVDRGDARSGPVTRIDVPLDRGETE